MPALFLLAYSLNLSLGASLRGVDPALAARYESSKGSFTCFDRSKSLPFGQVNDNFCDCLDGSDEPGKLWCCLSNEQCMVSSIHFPAGTSACANGVFYCRNRGHEPLRVNASMVDDGICGELTHILPTCLLAHSTPHTHARTDCCDGTDEPKGRCQSTCLAAGADMRKALRAQAAAFSAGAAKREAYVKEAGGKRAAWQAQLTKAKATARKQQAVVDKLQGALQHVTGQGMHCMPSLTSFWYDANRFLRCRCKSGSSALQRHAQRQTFWTLQL